LKEVWRKLFTKSFLQVLLLNKSTNNGDIAKNNNFKAFTP